MIIFSAIYADKVHFILCIFQKEVMIVPIVYYVLNLIPIEESILPFRNNLLLIHSLCMLESSCFNITQ